MKKKRLTWVDVTKGFLMILVVIGHYPGELDFPLAKYIYWFHMPAFFILSGLFFKPVLDKKDMKPTIHKRFMQLIVPYLFFLVSITLIRYGMEIGSGNRDLSWYLNDLWTLAVGGRFIRGAYGVFWFVTTLFFTYLFFLWLTKYFNRAKQILILAIFYIIAHFESIFAMHVIGGKPSEAAQSIPMLWNIDVALMAIVYFAIGYYLKDFWMDVSKRWMVTALAIGVTAVLLDSFQVIDYRLSMKFLRYDHFVLDLVIPLSFTIVLVGVFQFITAKLSLNWLQKIEQHSLSIMYLHIFADIILNDYFTYGIVGFTAIGVFIPIIVSILINKLLPNGKILLGGFSPKKKSTPIPT
ncbi:acyltransferase family protein [Sporosarcina sp. Marseille-Q4943]|uniref:acyltransferase family protein n=1 Tax=Sporosarcina sp. Marseille-Q4943 TaxID=2942204 RepID=UPI00208DB201|nr:acyltransferase family protein [Sporosarcina sp. Marseille-Q4943]